MPLTHKGHFTGAIVTHPERLSIPLRRRKPTVYAIWNDLFHEAVPPEYQFQVLAVMALAPRHAFLALTKRPERMLYFLSTYGGAKEWRAILSKRAYDLFGEEADCRVANAIEGCLGEGHNVGWPMSNLWHGLTVCNQAEADAKIPLFLQVPGKKYLSIEPMLGAIDLNSVNGMLYPFPTGWSRIAAVILGGETGTGARPLHPDWVRSIRDQCAAAGVPFFFKQWGEWAPTRLQTVEGCVNHTNGHYWYEFDPECGKFMKKIGRKKAGRLLDGRTHDDLPWLESKA
jgi:protein gp37